ncbi:calmodulin-binding protein 60 A-like [Cornus florida]|uniref:calmodulin-binding protein 60 A-like n=1 Tax=Cornus florida TaxID=4283 RepID=UPI00289AF2E2|nr:calmodulin-binding protein 60 A-like [Cornus florida]
MENQQFGDDSNSGSKLINSSEDEPTLVSPLLKKQLEVFVIQTFHQVIKPIFGPLIRPVVKEEIDSTLETILSRMDRNSRSETHPSESRILQLRFLIQPSLKILTGDQIEGEESTPIKVALIDGSTEETVKWGPESSAKVEIVALKGDFNDVEGHDWTTEEFNQKVVREREGKKSILTGDAYLNLEEGLGTLGIIHFTHNSNWMKKTILRLGARVMDSFSCTRVREAISEPFTLEDCRNSLYKKHYPPHLSDEVWRLDNIANGGAFHKRLSRENITNVKEFLTLSFINLQRLHDIIGTGSKSQIMINHARTCILDKKVYLYPSSSQQKNGVVFSVVGQLMGRLLECQFVPFDTLSKTEKADAHKLVVSAFEHWEAVVAFDDIPSLMHACSQTHPSNSPRLENPSGHNAGTGHAINVNNDMQPSTSIHYSEDMSNMDVCGYTIDNMELLHTSDPGEVPSSLSFDPESMLQDFDAFVDFSFRNTDYNPKQGSLTVELAAAEQSATSSSRLVCAQARVR